MTSFRFDDWQQDAIQQIEAALAWQLTTYFPETSQHLADAMRYSLLAGGKRLRPLLCLAACEMLEQPQQKALTAACAIEFMHTYSLIHDDLPAMDNDDMRRGKPSNHKAFDEATAILAGDALQTSAFEILAHQGAYDEATRLAMIRTLAHASGAAGMVAGQMQDMDSQGKALSLEELETLHQLKTGRLIEASLVLGAQAAGVLESSKLEQMQQLGKLLGLAFQIQDDLLDVTGNTDMLGKSTGADTALSKSTFPALLGLARSQHYAHDLCQQALSQLVSFGASAAPLRAIAQLIVERQR